MAGQMKLPGASAAWHYYGGQKFGRSASASGPADFNRLRGCAPSDTGVTVAVQDVPKQFIKSIFLDD
jgi:hypothetical protein